MSAAAEVSAQAGWLMPVVPPMVSAATGALLIPHLAPGVGRQTMFYGCFAMFGLSLIAAPGSDGRLLTLARALADRLARAV